MAKLHYKESPTPAQKSSFASYLAEDEELILVTGLSQAYIRSKFIMYLMWPGAIFFGLGLGLGWLLHFTQTAVLIVSSILGILAATLKTWHIYHANRYLLTTRRVIIKKGLFAVKLYAALYDKITHLEVDQGFIDRLFLHHGTIIVNTAGLNKGEIVLQYVDYPMELKNLMERLINREREQFGLRGGPVSTVEGEIIS
ncbi:PH domain-containing protein [Candidatus Daviesbacteria bacterium]|nr:PH domain-containing protein [Candidatus Daviesbacteria bacterium]